MFRKVFGRTFALVAMLAVVASTVSMPAAAQSETISADIGNCRTNVDVYQVQLRTQSNRARLPRNVTIEFADQTTATAEFANVNDLGTAYYYLDDYAETYRLVEAVAVYTTANTSTFGADWTFKLTSWPCIPTYDVEGTILQRGNQKPVEGLEVCIVETGACTTTGMDGSFSIAGVENGTYTLVSDGPVYKPLSTTVTVEGADVYVGLTQYRGGGRN